MRPGLRILIAAAAVAQTLVAGSALAQDAQPAATAPPAETVGPRELRNFQLNGTVTRPAETAPAPAPAPATRPAPAATDAAPAPRSQAPAPATTEPARARADRAAQSQAPAPARSVTIDLPPPTPSADLPTPVVAPVDEPTAGGSDRAFAPDPEPATLGIGTDGPSTLPWLLALLALAGGAAFYFLRLRPRAQFAGAAGVSQFVGTPEAGAAARPVPRPAPPVPAPPRSPPPSTGIVSTRLRPWLEIEFSPERAIVDDDKVSIEFVMAIFNSGSGPAREILIEGALFNAGPLQDKQIQMFFENPVAQGERIPGLPPLQRLSVRSAVVLPRSQVKPIEIEGRPLLVPLVAFNALYRFGGGSEGQTSVSHLVGKQTQGEKLAPFRLDLGPRIFRGLGAREHELKVRN